MKTKKILQFDTELLNAKKYLMYQCHNRFWIITTIIKKASFSPCWKSRSLAVMRICILFDKKVPKYSACTAFTTPRKANEIQTHNYYSLHTCTNTHYIRSIKMLPHKIFPFIYFPWHILKLLFHQILIFCSCIFNKHEDPINHTCCI